mgnify:CR=1 FL=1
MNKCLACYQPLASGENGYHKACARRMFGTPDAPRLDFSPHDLGEMGKSVLRRSIALTGVQPKLSVDIPRDGKTLPARFTVVGLWGRYILKPQSEQFQALPELEDLTMHLAQAAKLKVVPHCLIPFDDGSLCYITRRIDRLEPGEKLPMEDLCPLAGRLIEANYKGSHEQIARTIAQFSSAPKLDVVNFWEIVVFCWITGNADMHLKNFSLYAPQPHRYLLTPAYDLLSTALVMPEDNEELALTLCGKKRKIKRSDWIEAMTSTGLEEKVANNILGKFAKFYPRWVQLIESSFLPSAMQTQLQQLIATRLENLAPQS